MYWLEVTVLVDGEAAEAVSDFLRPYAHQNSVVLEQLGDQANPDPQALLDEVRVKIYIPGDHDTDTLRRRIVEGLYYLGLLHPIPEPEFRALVDKDWATAWRKHYQAFRLGQRLWIQPSWQKIDVVPDDDVILTLDPGMAFGTGAHPSTRMCLQALEASIATDARVLDVGTGSGILAVAAAKLGASAVVALDVDWQAAISASANAELNQVAGRVHALQGELAALVRRPWDMVLVNILAPVITQLLEHHRLMHYVAPSGRLILSGIIAEQARDVEAVLREQGGYVVDRLAEGDWICLVAAQA